MRINRKELKKKARANLKKNYINLVIACLIMALFASGYSFSKITSNAKTEEETDFQPFSSTTLPRELKIIIGNIEEINLAEQDDLGKIEKKFNLIGAKEGVLANILANRGTTNSFLIGTLNTINKFVFNGQILAGVITGISTIILLFYNIFVANILAVGEKRFFLESRTYHDTKVPRLLYIYRVKKVANVAKIMFQRQLFTILWSFTIVGGFIKYYTYLMIPYILAENPEISKKEAFLLSKEMMKGKKWQAFLLDLSFIPWRILSVITLGVASYFYINPFLTATKTELYVVLRENAITEKMAGCQLLKDKYLLEHKESEKAGKDIYQINEFSLEESIIIDWIDLDFERSYSLNSLVLIFFFMCFLGWIWEVGLFFFQHGIFVNRGSMTGPWLPIYGSGSVLFILLLKPIAKRPGIFFFGAFLTAGVLEYTTSFVMEKLFNEKWWDYTDMFLNINGRVCLEGLIFFGAGAMLIVYLIAPLIDDALTKLKPKTKNIICLILLTLFLSDLVYSRFYPNTGEGITTLPTTKTSIINK